MSLIFWPEDVHGADQFGVKGMELLALARAGAPLPAWFLLPAEAFYISLIDQEYDFLLRHADATTPPEIHFSFQLDYDLNNEIKSALSRLCPKDERVAVRYSPSLENGRLPPRGSESHLFVAVEDVARAVRAIWKSHFSQASMKARVDAGFPAVPKPPAVVIQRMLNPESSGLCFTANPSTGSRSEAVVQAVPGLLTVLASRDAPRDVFFVSNKGKVTGKKIVEKRIKHVCHHDSMHGIEQVTVPFQEAEKPCLSDKQAAEIAAQARKIALSAGLPQRVDWAIEDGSLYVLAAREIEELKGMPDPEAFESVWDFAPLASVLPGVAQPLAGSLCRRLMTEGWCEALREAGLSGLSLADATTSLEEAVGWVEGRLCLNRLALAKALARARFPKSSLADMAAFFGCTVEQILDAAARDEMPKSRSIEAFASLRKSSVARRLGRTSRPLAESFCAKAKAFYNALSDAIEVQRPEAVLARLKCHREHATKALAIYSRAAMLVIQRWINLRKLTRSRCGDNDGTLARSLLVPAKPSPQEETLSKIAKLAMSSAKSKRLTDALRAGRLLEADSILSTTKELSADYAALNADLRDASAWVETGQFSDSERARLLTASILASGAPVDLRVEGAGNESQAERLRKSAQEKLDALLKGDEASGKLVRAASLSMQQSLGDLAAMRRGFCMILNAYGRAFQRLGQSLFEAGCLESADDIRWLTEDEVLAFFDARLPERDLGAIVQRRRLAEVPDESEPPPALIFTARGCLHLSRQVPRRSLGDLRQGSAKVTGIGCGIGSVRARVRVAESPQSLLLHSGEILALPVSDIRFRFYLPAVSGLIVEHGSAVDELVVLALRLGRPVVLGPHGICLWLSDGEVIEMQAATGSIRKTGSTVAVL